MKDSIVLSPAVETQIGTVGIRVGESAMPMIYFHARLDRRNVLCVGTRMGIKPVHVAVEDDGAVSNKLFEDGVDLEGNWRSHLARETLHVAHALGARQAALRGKDDLIDAFAMQVIGRRGTRWREAVSTALLGEWADPFIQGHRLGPEAIAQLRKEAEQLHRQLLPLWHRRTCGSRLLLLDMPLGDGLSLYDVLASVAEPGSMAATSDFHEARLTTILHALHPDERAVAMAWAHKGIATWTDAALFVGVPDPGVFGERVRRKVRRTVSRSHDGAAKKVRKARSSS
ncbi:hypothetical protein O1Q96_01330 (plasmid) [Streptomyces sp. Qhu-G9]|uniref:hypothetical protein n=1 Tax=Streptomyces sp. Qhu-G9 TaxID=3452799 RepID=UPI0022ABF34E|nr:hypothetical protein [Streptomyces aurantiacus]WAU78499.1 hypothetical protein O1Q96_01330 [Streptomyces aurantiacus]